MNMQDPHTAYAVVGGVIGLVVLGLIAMLVVKAGGKRKAAEWIAAAKAAGLSAKARGPFPLMELRGRLDGIAVELENKLELVTKRRRKDDERYVPQANRSCRALAAIPVATGDLQLGEETLLGKLGKLVGGTDIETGDAAFDKKFSIKAKDAARARQLLDADTRAALLDCERALGGEIAIDAGRIEWHGGQVTSHARALEIVTRLAAAARTFAARG